jgi:hypothetical protein
MVNGNIQGRGEAMRWLFWSLTVAMALATPPTGALAQPAAGANVGNCEPGDKIDGSTMGDARKKIEQAGYKKVSGLRKGCDNSWHGKAEKDGAEVRIVLNPQGLVLPEGD